MTAQPPKPPPQPVRTLSDGVANPKQGSGGARRGAPAKPKDE
jgi:hypothetical protein